MLALLDVDQEEARFSSGRTVEGIEVEQPVNKTALMSYEERNALVEKREQEKIEQRKKELRFNNRKSFEELLSKLLNGDIFDIFADK